MTDGDILNMICRDLPDLDCEPGCTACCTVTLMSPEELRRVPREYKTGEVGLLPVPMRMVGGRRTEARVPVPARMLLGLVARPRMAVTEMAQEGLLLAGFGLEGVTCPWAAPGEGCRIYEWRPFVCRIMGAGGGLGRLTCPRGVRPSFEMPETVVMQRFLWWSNLFPPERPGA